MKKKKSKKNKLLFFFLIILVLAILFLILFESFKPKSGDSSIGKKNRTLNFVSVPIPIGAYSNYSVKHQPNGIIDENQNDKLSFDNDNHYLAQLLWFGEDGFFEYHLVNPIPSYDKPSALSLFLEACSETWGYSLDHKTDISIYVNNKKICTCLIPGDFGGVRGKYTPDWWPTANTQYGEPLFIEVRKDGTYIAKNYTLDLMREALPVPNFNFKKVSDVTIDDLNLKQNYITLKVGVDKNAEHKGGMNLLGEKFGNYPKTLTLGLEYNDNIHKRIYQPTVAEIIDNPNKFLGKIVLLAVHPGGWSCPANKSTSLPYGFSRSAMVIYDNTGCLYGNGTVLIGRILSPEIHTINVPGNETIIVEGIIQLDKDGIPYLVGQ
ncbi:MAG: hypothetical protein GWP09_01140 [Nitrospiraceae bacterium]|nr:hypothetical protein [Nitrospiraceae bacterium]